MEKILLRNLEGNAIQKYYGPDNKFWIQCEASEKIRFSEFTNNVKFTSMEGQMTNSLNHFMLVGDKEKIKRIKEIGEINISDIKEIKSGKNPISISIFI